MKTQNTINVLRRSARYLSIVATSVIQNESISFLAAKNTHYTIVISTGKPPSLQVDK